MTSKKASILLFILIAGILGLYFYNKYRVAPSVELQSLPIITESGESFNWEAIKGRKVIVSFYASWCGDCLKELKILSSVKSAELNDVDVLAITDESIEKMIDFKTRKQYPYTFLKLKKSFNEIGIYSIPTTYIVNTKGEITLKTVGYIDWKDASTIHRIKALLE